MTKRRQIGIRGLKNQASRIVDEVRERGTEYVVTKRGEPVAVLRPWCTEDTIDARREAVAEILARIELTAERIATAAGRRSAATAVAAQRR